MMGRSFSVQDHFQQINFIIIEIREVHHCHTCENIHHSTIAVKFIDDTKLVRGYLLNGTMKMKKYICCHLGLNTANRNFNKMQFAREKSLPHSAQTWSDVSGTAVVFLARCSKKNIDTMGYN